MGQSGDAFSAHRAARELCIAIEFPARHVARIKSCVTVNFSGIQSVTNTYIKNVTITSVFQTEQALIDRAEAESSSSGDFRLHTPPSQRKGPLWRLSRSLELEAKKVMHKNLKQRMADGMYSACYRHL